MANQKKVLVTGATRGMGKEISRVLAGKAIMLS